MRKLLIICAAVLQVLLLASIGGRREYVLRTGRTIYLRTMPVGPGDLSGKDYVKLRYEISNIEKKYLRDGLAEEAKDTSHHIPRGKPVYTVLRLDNGNIADVVYVTDKKPAKGQLYIRGITDYSSDSIINVLYGIETYFVEQGKNEQLQQGGISERARTTLGMEVHTGK